MRRLALIVCAILSLGWLYAQDTTIVAIEYFVDDDPGYGLGTSVTLTSGTQVTVSNLLINTSAMDVGFHQLFFRAQDEHGKWGLVEPRLFYVDGTDATARLIDELEYYIDDDPGYGSGILINSFSSAAEVTQNMPISTSSLGPGFHTLFFRARSGSEWGIVEQRLVFVDLQESTAVLVDSLEYYFDDDPGYGLGTILDGFTAATQLIESPLLAASSLSTGFHTLFVRAKAEGGAWGIPEQRLVFVDQSGGTTLVDQVEYFFDADPGYGSGILIDTFTPADTITIAEMIMSSFLSPGFHKLFVRARYQGGPWGIPEQRLVYLDNAGSVFTDIVEVEYFFDIDPGYGAGISIPATDSLLMTDFNFLVETTALSDGEHVFHVRAKNENGDWGAMESLTFSAFGPGRELDSASLRVVYEQLGGANWLSNSNWLTGTLDTWQGVTMTGNRVDTLDLSTNQLIGHIPFQLGYLDAMTQLDLSDNQLSDTVPLTFQELGALGDLKLHANQLNELPDLSGLGNLSVANLDSNFFDFGDLEPLASLSTYTYDNQKIYGDMPLDSLVSIGQPLSWTVLVEGVNNSYQWYLNDQSITAADLSTYALTSFAATDTGAYYLEVNNSLLPDMTLTSEKYRFHVSDFEEDSLALVSLYQATGGVDWTNKANWLTGSLSSWQGVTMTGDRATSLDLPANNMAGKIPKDFSYASALATINFSDNSLVDSIPASFNKIGGLTSLDISNNDIRSIPNFSPLQSLAVLDVSQNRLQFGDLENNLGIASFNYSAQDSITFGRDTLMETNDNVTIQFEVSGANNSYQWYKDDVAIDGANTDRIDIQAIDFDDEGSYRLEITNAQVTGLTLTSGELRVGVTSLERDMAALRYLYEQTGGENWDPPVNWLTNPIEEWGTEVSIQENRVVSVELPDRGLVGSLPGKIRDVTSLETLDLSDNDIESLPNMSQMPSLNDFDISGNRLHFDDLEPNVNITGFQFNPQQPIEVSLDSILVTQGSDLTLSFEVGGSNNDYQWLQNGIMVPGATETLLLLDSINYTSMGLYTLEVTSPVVSDVDPTFKLTSEDQYALATANIEFFPTFRFADDSEGLVEEGSSSLIGIKEDGPYDSVKDVSIVNERIYFENIILGDYLLAARAAEGYQRTKDLGGGTIDEVEFIPTYFDNELEWDSANVLNLREDISESLTMLRVPPPIVDGIGTVEMSVESDFAEDGESGRIEARRRVRKAGCSLRRNTRVGGGREEEDEEWELIAYQETDENGEVDFGFLPAGLYRINIQYPGIPMDPDSFIEFSISEDEEEDGYILAATIYEDRIDVAVVEELGYLIEYFKDLQVYPNPADEVVNIGYEKLGTNMVRYQLLDLSGKTYQERQLEKGRQRHYQLETTGLKEGVYLLRFYDASKASKGLVTYKLIIRH